MSRITLLAGAARHVLPFAIMMAPATLDELRARVEEIDARLAEIQAGIETEEGDIADDIAQEVEDLTAEKVKVSKQIDIRQKLQPSQPQPSGQGRRSQAEPQNRNDPDGGRRPVTAQSRVNDQRHGFKSFGEFAAAVRSGCIQGNTPDQRLMNAATTYGNEGTGADGGFLVPPEFSRQIWEKVQAEENLLNRCAPLQTGTNSMTIPKDETTPWQSSGGIQVYWEGEAASIPPSKPAFEMSTLRLVKLTALVPISDELLEDAVGLESWLRAKAPAKMASKINTGIVDGTGVGQPLGILRSPSLISVAKNVSQPADSLWFENISNMWSRMYAPWRRNAIWLINQDIEPELDQMAFDPQATAGKVPIYLPAGGLSASPYATLKGRPVVPIEACKTLGDKGDIILVDLMQYWGMTKAGGIKTDTSMHLYFDQALTTFRFIFRLNGQPAWSAAIDPQNGSTTRSWAVTLDARG